jgi:hypothetical protein
MRTKVITVICALAIGWASLAPTYAGNSPTPEAVVADVVLARPGCLVATAVGSVFFVVALPFAALSKSTKKTAEVLVVKPAKATFTRPLGDFEEIN